MKKYTVPLLAGLAVLALALVACILLAGPRPAHCAAPPPDGETVSVSPPADTHAAAYCPCSEVGTCACQPDGNCGCGMAVERTRPRPKADPFRATYAEHASTGKPLVVWVNTKPDARTLRTLRASCAVMVADEFLGRKGPCVLVGVWCEGESYVAAELPEGATAEDILRAAAAKQRALSEPPPRLFVPPPFRPMAFRPAMNFGGCAGGS